MKAKARRVAEKISWTRQGRKGRTGYGLAGQGRTGHGRTGHGRHRGMAGQCMAVSLRISDQGKAAGREKQKLRNTHTGTEGHQGYLAGKEGRSEARHGYGVETKMPFFVYAKMRHFAKFIFFTKFRLHKNRPNIFMFAKITRFFLFFLRKHFRRENNISGKRENCLNCQAHLFVFYTYIRGNFRENKYSREFEEKINLFAKCFA